MFSSVENEKGPITSEQNLAVCVAFPGVYALL